MRECLPKKKKTSQWCTFSLEWCFTWCKCPWRFILVKALAQVPPACVPFAFYIAAKCCSDTDAIIQRVVFFLTWVERFIRPNHGIVAWKWWTPKMGFMRKNSFSLHYVFCPGVTVKDSDYQKGNPVWEEQHNQFLYLCHRNNLNQRNLKSLLFSGFLWFSFALFASKCHMTSSCFGS